LDNYPFPIRDDVNFRCVGCGRCCDSAPQLSISEAIRLVDDFPLMASIVSMQTDQNLPGWRGEIAKMTMERSQELGALQMEATNSNWQSVKFVTTLSAVVIQPPSTQRCPALQSDGRCGIYDRRPNVCRYVPAQHLAPKKRQQLTVSVFIDKHDQDCDWSPSAPQLLVGGVLVNPEMSASFQNAEHDDLRDAALLHALVKDGTTFTAESEEVCIEDFLETAMNSQTGESRFPFSLLALLLEDLNKTGLLPEGYPPFSAKDIVRRQVTTCERMIAKNVARKDSRDREVTAELRFMLSMNKSILRFLEEEAS
jgi:Fe-S-cluster containining protein